MPTETWQYCENTCFRFMRASKHAVSLEVKTMSGIHLDKSKVSSAVGGLFQIAQKSKKEDELIEEVDILQMQICLKKIPQKQQAIKLKLPNSLKQPDMEVCLFVKDLDKDDRDYEPTVRHFQTMFRKRGIDSVSEIIPLKSLKTEYKPYEAKRNLANAYDVFLADARIIRLLPTYLGKHFYGKKKCPVQVNLQAKDLSKEIDSALDNSRCVISAKGSSSVTDVGNMNMSQEEIVENVIAIAKQVSAGVPGGATNVKQLSLKLRNSVSIPLYMSEGGPQEVTIPKDLSNAESVEAEEISTLFGAKVKVYPSGHIKIIKDGEVEKPVKKRKRSTRKKPAHLKQKQKSKGRIQALEPTKTKTVKRLKRTK